MHRRQQRALIRELRRLMAMWDDWKAPRPRPRFIWLGLLNAPQSRCGESGFARVDLATLTRRARLSCKS